MAKVAIIGSCITRDLWSGRGDSFADLLYVSRTSLPSLMAEPVSGFEPFPERPPELGPFQHRAVIADAGKTALARLAAFRPTHLIFDFIDERYDLLAVGASLVTASWELEASGYLGQRPFAGARRISRLSAEYDGLWQAACVRFAAVVAEGPLRDARLILHSARWATQGRRRDGAPMELPTRESPAEIAAHNALLARSEERLAAAFPQLARVAAPEHRTADEAHVWGLSPFHYVPEYYAAVAAQLAELGIVVRDPTALGA